MAQVTAYQAHLAAIRHWLPVNVLRLDEQVPLHDARVRMVRYTVATNTLIIGLQNWFTPNEVKPFYLCYRNVISFDSRADPAKGLPGPHGYGDLGYDELDITPENDLVHRLLFSSGIEVEIICTDVALAWTEPQFPAVSAP